MARARHGVAVASTQALAGLSLAFALSGATARAQTVPSVDTRTWQPSPDPEASLVLEPATTAGPWRWNLGAWAQYAQTPVVYRSRSGADVQPVAHFVGLDLAGSVGLGERVSVGFDLPLFLWQNGDIAIPPGFVQNGTVPATGVGDASLLGKVTLLSNDCQGVHGGFGLAALGGLELPTGNRASFLSNGDVAGWLKVLAEYALGVAAIRAELGYSARSSERSWPVGSFEDVATFGQAIPWAIGVVVQPKLFAPVLDSGDRQLWEVAAHGSLPGGPTAPFASGASRLSPAMVSVDDRVALGHGRDAHLIAGVQIGVDGAIGVPLVRALVALQWAPRAHDRDGDGVPDDRDECPDLPEDRDGIQDDDGCPEDDADGDGILDTDDACPLDPGNASSDPKQNGCPANAPVPVPVPVPAPAPAPAQAPTPAPAEKTP